MICRRICGKRWRNLSSIRVEISHAIASSRHGSLHEACGLWQNFHPKPMGEIVRRFQFYLLNDP